MANDSRFSGTPLVKKLGLRSGDRCYVHHAPAGFLSMIQPLPEDITFLNSPERPLDWIHVFVDRFDDLKTLVSKLRPLMTESGMVWVSWPKKSSGVDTDINEDRIREVAFALDLVDVKVCSVNDVWSALKLVIRLTLRKKSK
jgi:hypothetical protein